MVNGLREAANHDSTVVESSMPNSTAQINGERSEALKKIIVMDYLLE